MPCEASWHQINDLIQTHTTTISSTTTTTTTTCHGRCFQRRVEQQQNVCAPASSDSAFTLSFGWDETKQAAARPRQLHEEVTTMRLNDGPVEGSDQDPTEGSLGFRFGTHSLSSCLFLERFHSCSACIVPLAKSMGANSNLDLRGDTNCFNFSLFMQLLLFLCYGPFKRGSKRNSRKTSIAARGRGRIEFVHSLVCSGCVTIKDGLGETKEEIILPAQGVESTKSEAIGGNLVNSFERYLFGSSFDTFILTLAGKFSKC